MILLNLKFYLLWVFLVIISLNYFVNGISLAVMSVDLGNENIKIGIVSSGKSMEIVLNPDSSRRTPMAIAFRDNERFFTEAALTTSTRFPEKVYTHLLYLIGKEIDNPLVKLYQKNFPFHKISKDNETSNILLTHPDGEKFTSEQLLAMLLEKARLYAELYIGNNVKIYECVIVVPSFFSQSERKAIIRSAKLAGLNVLQLINSNTAVALNFGLYRTNDFVENIPKNYIFYDMGSSSTTATIVSYRIRRNKDSAYSVKTPELTIRGIGFNRTLGGFEMQLRLRDYLAKQFSVQTKKPLTEVIKNKRAMSKLLKEAGRVKNMLSANNEILSRIENVMDDIDFKFVVKRSDYEDLCQDLFDKVLDPIESALLNSGITLEEIEQIILFGGNTRTPKIQQILTEYSNKKEIGKSLNTDEAACLGGAYLAGKLSKGFKAKDFDIIENNLYPFVIEFLKKNNDEEKLISKTLFTRGNAYPMKKVFTFNKKNTDFYFDVIYGDISFLNEEVKIIDSKKLFRVELKNFEAITSKYQDEKYEPKGVKAYFNLNENGILKFMNAEYVYNEKVVGINFAENDSNIIGNAINNIGNTISNFFNNKENSSINILNETLSKNNISLPDFDLNKTLKNSNYTKEKIQDKILTYKEPIEFIIKNLGFNFGNVENFSNSKNKLQELNYQEIKKLARDQAKNTFESFIVENKVKLFEEEFEKASTELERENLNKILLEASEWLEIESNKVEENVLNEKLKELTSHFKNLYQRVREHKDRPDALKSLNNMLNWTKTFLSGARNLSLDDQVFTDVELTKLDFLIDSIEKWKEEKIIEQNNTPLFENPVILISEIGEKIGLLDREVKYLVNKTKIISKKPKEKLNDTKTPNKFNDENSKKLNDSEQNASKINLNEDNLLNESDQDKHSEL